MTPDRDEALARDIRSYCAEIGQDQLLVQGPGGNVSWKEGSTLWVKASGTWLAHADDTEIFIPVDLQDLQQSIERQDFSAKASILAQTEQRPSIETMLHALMPHRIVVHLHAIDVLVQLVLRDANDRLARQLEERKDWVFVDYNKPGAELAAAVDEALRANPGANIVFLKNHGIVLGGENIDGIRGLLARTLDELQTFAPCNTEAAPSAVPEHDLAKLGYAPSRDPCIHALSCDPVQIARLNENWALYPDHVVFLGAEPSIWSPELKLSLQDQPGSERSPYIFVPGIGTYEFEHATPAQKEQMRCYSDVVNRLPTHLQTDTLSISDIADLLDWDAEKFRQGNN
ncbi:class II aldolase/adducin family protein [uncultured Roseibium sp.]|uniref:class II aldolase/adducin family protein n=1 Tax=uncultured Roseibium sp. TaxID=1936171 RepID=UPI002628621D|nr:class II aldolase/adducin family protein [uncultured Roseibium sp.]